MPVFNSFQRFDLYDILVIQNNIKFIEKIERIFIANFRIVLNFEADDKLLIWVILKPRLE